MIFTKDNLSITFTAYNCLPYLKLAIYSFLEFYPQLKNAIIVFDDNSTDETTEWLSQENIRHITWSKYNYIRDIKIYMKVFKQISPSPNLSLRNSFMVQNMLQQIKSRYVMINDADIVFLKTGFMEKYSNIMQHTDSRLCVVEEQYNYQWKLNNSFPKDMIQKFLGKYFLLYNYHPEYVKRFHLCFSLLDLAYLKSKGIIFDDITDKTFIKNILTQTILETGSSFTYQILQKDIPYFSLEKDVFNSISRILTNSTYNQHYIYHFRWKSSKEQTANISPKQEKPPYYLKSNKDLRSCPMLRQKVQDICSKYSIKNIIE